MSDKRIGPRIKPIDPAEFTARRNRKGRSRALTPNQVLELIAWIKARRALGNCKTKAAELGISPGTMTNYFRRIRRGDARGRGES